ncbi:cfem domain-containing protein [Diaporthe amygdali]|uniref:cfem domain-containing protein n=1 Tax=Phomopsis amygdali TaxID=1214568 RepID=UPI0022FDBDAA|nr:cfem domain-containing protein [Diaporthe amygdali]KAJ0114282.1 cfem domain-containing protein [Diaporthe amygdali]
MKTATLILILLQFLIAGATAQSSLSEVVAELPSCALTCLITAISHSPCSLTDVDCTCSNKKLNDEAQVCGLANCTIKDGLRAKNITETLCQNGAPPDRSLVPVFSGFLALAGSGCAAFAATNIRAAVLGMGQDVWNVPFDHITWLLLIFWVNMGLYAVTRGLIRASIIFFYMRIFPSTSNYTVYRLVFWTGVLNAVHITCFTLAVILQCQPTRFFWYQWDKQGPVQGHCGNANALAWAAAGAGIALDLWLFALPWPGIWKLNLSWRRKIFAGIMLSVGVAFFVISLVRLKTINTFTTTINPSRDFVEVGIWSGIEIDVGVVCPCLPSIRILLVRYAPRCMGLGSSADHDLEEQQQASRPARGRHGRRLRKRSYVNFDVEGGSSGRSGKMSLTAVASTPPGSTFTDGKKSPWNESEYRLATFKRHSTEMVDDVIVASDV